MLTDRHAAGTDLLAADAAHHPRDAHRAKMPRGAGRHPGVHAARQPDQAHVGIDHGYRHARRVIARLRHPLWDDLTPEELAVLGEAANAIQRACKLTDGDIDEPGDGEPAMPARVALFGALHGRFGGELTEAQIARL